MQEETTPMSDDATTAAPVSEEMPMVSEEPMAPATEAPVAPAEGAEGDDAPAM